jgi:hypothetical protein
MNLYDPLYTTRSSVAVPGRQVAAPRQYEAAVDAELSPRGQVGGVLGGVLGGAGAGVGRGTFATAPPPPPPSAPRAPQLEVVQQNQLSFQQTETRQVEDFFEYKFPFPVRLASRQSALLPFLQKTMKIERMSMYNPRVDRGNPQLGAQLESNADVPFEPGPVTFFEDGRYAGEAVIEYMPRGDKRLVSYGVDYDIQVSAKPQAQPETMARLTIQSGVAVLYMERLQTTTYSIRSKATKPKALIIEHARQGGRKLKSGQPWETTDSYYRFRVNLTPNQITELPVTEIVSRQTDVNISDLTREDFVNLFSNRETPQEVQTKLGQIVDAQEKIAEFRQSVSGTESEIASLFKDQERLRENIKALRDTREEQELRSRYLAQLTKQETQIDASRAEIDRLTKDIAAAENELAVMISKLSWQ